MDLGAGGEGDAFGGLMAGFERFGARLTVILIPEYQKEEEEEKEDEKKYEIKIGILKSASDASRTLLLRFRGRGFELLAPSS